MKRKKLRVDFSAHCTVVVELNESDGMYDEAMELAEQYVQGNHSITASWEADDDGVSDADDEDDVDVKA